MARILVVDDNADVREVVRDTLEFKGHEVIVAGNGVEALRALQHFEADLVITDIVMPEKEGIETIMEIRSTNSEIKIIAMSGGGSVSPDGYLTPAIMLGADHALAKPFTSSELIAAVDKLVPRVSTGET